MNDTESVLSCCRPTCGSRTRCPEATWQGRRPQPRSPCGARFLRNIPEGVWAWLRCACGHLREIDVMEKFRIPLEDPLCTVHVSGSPHEEAHVEGRLSNGSSVLNIPTVFSVPWGGGGAWGRGGGGGERKKKNCSKCKLRRLWRRGRRRKENYSLIPWWLQTPPVRMGLPGVFPNHLCHQFRVLKLKTESRISKSL